MAELNDVRHHIVGRNMTAGCTRHDRKERHGRIERLRRRTRREKSDGWTGLKDKICRKTAICVPGPAWKIFRTQPPEDSKRPDARSLPRRKMAMQKLTLLFVSGNVYEIREAAVSGRPGHMTERHRQPDTPNTHGDTMGQIRQQGYPNVPQQREGKQHERQATAQKAGDEAQ